MMVFLIEALVFILIGFSLRGVIDRVGGFDAVFNSMAVPVVGVIVTVVLARFAWVGGSEALLNGLRAFGVGKARPLGWRQSTILAWTGMRGVVTLAVALSLPQSMPGRDFMLVAAFAVIFVTVIGQGTSLAWLIRIVKPIDGDPLAPLDLPASEAAVARAKLDAVEKSAFDADGTLIHPQLLETYQSRLRATRALRRGCGLGDGGPARTFRPDP